MWVAKLRIKHEDCVIGERCKKFNIISVGVPFNSYNDQKFSYHSHFETLSGDEKNIKSFIEDLKKDKSIINLDVSGNSVFFLYKIPIKKKIPTTHYSNRIFWLKPVIVDSDGYETWEIGTWERDLLNKFISSLKKENYELKILNINNEKLDEVYFPQVMPNLTKNQKRAIELAYQYGYYDFPRKTELEKLAKAANKSLSTFREHLRKAEKKLMPDLIRNVKDED